MKKIIISILSVIILFSACSREQPAPEPIKTTEQVAPSAEELYVKSVWFTYYELQSLMTDNEGTFYGNIKTAFETVKNIGFNTVTVQVRPCADAFYKSNYFPSSKYCFGIQGAELPFDPLGVMCTVADELGLRIEAWINPYRVSQESDINSLCDTNIAKLWYNDEKTKSYVSVLKKGIYFNPAIRDVTELITNGVREIVANYNIDGIHFDDYFYPTTHKKIDKKEYKEYKSGGGELSLGDWRRENINTMVKSVYSAVKEIKPAVTFGISPASNISNNYKNLYADVEKWAGSEGFADYICPQIYFGFKNVYQPFMFTTKKWIGITNKCKLYVGLPLYKCSNPDKYAAEEEKERINEFVNNHNIIARQITYLSKLDEIGGYYVFSYSSILDETKKEEVENMKSVMQNSSQQ